MSNPVRVLDGQLNDPLARTTDFESRTTTRYRFEVWAPTETFGDGLADTVKAGGRWRLCEDPRFMSEEAKQLKLGRAAG